MICFLRMANDYLEEAEKCSSIAGAVRAFEHTARELARYGQYTEAAIHIAKTLDEVVEYPDYVLSLGPRGGVRKQRC